MHSIMQSNPETGCCNPSIVLLYQVVDGLMREGGRDIPLVKLGEEEGPDLGLGRWPGPALSNRTDQSSII